MYGRILVPLDGSSFGERALPYAVSLASRWGAELELATVASPIPTPAGARAPGVAGDESRERGLEAAEKYLEEVEGRLREEGFEGGANRAAITPGNVARALVRHAVEREADLVVMTTHGRGAVERAWLGSAADGVIRRSPVPVLLIRPEEDGAEAAARPFRRVLVPLDGSGAAELLLDKVPPLLEPDQAGYLLLRVIPALTPVAGAYLPHVMRDAHEHEIAEQKAREYLEGLAAPLLEGGAEVETRVETEGQPAAAILRTAEAEDVDLIAMSTHGRGGAARLLLGSVADKVIRGAGVPVLLHREPEDE